MLINTVAEFHCGWNVQYKLIIIIIIIISEGS